MTIEILYQDQDFIAIHKPAGILVHKSRLDPRDTHVVLQIVRNQINQQVFPVHRLDRATSGVMLFALSSEFAKMLSKLFSDRLMKKEYWALVRGHLKNEITVDYPLKSEFKSEQISQTAQTHFRSLAEVELPVEVDRYPASRYSLIEASPRTGRTHQIRKHLKHLNHPIIGDSNYGNGKHNRYFSEKLNLPGLFLSCIGISFLHPVTQMPIEIRQRKLDTKFEKAFRTLGMSCDL